MSNGAFGQTVSSEDELQSLLGSTPSKLAANKVITELDEHCRDFLAKSPFVVVSTSDASGSCDVSPRGDAPGFVRVLDENRLVIPERPGNKRADSLRNILNNPRIGLIFLIPGLEETLRINGRACIVRDPDVLEPMSAQGKAPTLGIGVEVEECFVHCAKALKRSKLWQPESWASRDQLPNPAQMLRDHCKLPGLTTEDIAQSLQESYTKRLY
ncbi:pyridoxamine 5'-phosphate oxidase family protein [Tumebacillus sp. ITR2]|uniref:Pyridoxamine 5'-phosphate oxidase family protein n=1 Tax=Tumebacillus amylolyticus TaxID=2801339 RepID=A0ABS1J8D4_9BACL|nr:pyridoxamine 5'-phosphate oxidase family protein [Tumebacillus amylolyticus]MBL0386541.1 pyridoxamine 5'-phosphate oxidase family protein [Tumebacillus amylolyticus]